MGTAGPLRSKPVEKATFSPDRAHRVIPLPEPLRGIIPVIHTLYDYNKGIS
jgi:hypothetical protein